MFGEVSGAEGFSSGGSFFRAAQERGKPSFGGLSGEGDLSFAIESSGIIQGVKNHDAQDFESPVFHALKLDGEIFSEFGLLSGTPEGQNAVDGFFRFSRVPLISSAATVPKNHNGDAGEMSEEVMNRSFIRGKGLERMTNEFEEGFDLSIERGFSLE